jgi:predicted O-linked N-acetylglucosamine transferase (SPINDLY family)
MGVDYVDYLVVDHVVIPAASRPHYRERLIYLPRSYQANDRTRPRPEAAPTRAEVGLPPSGFVYACFNSPYKITPDVFASWLAILRAVEGSVLWCYADHPAVVANLRRAAVAGGIDAARLVFAPPLAVERHLARYRLVDLFLDTFPCGAHTTASDALWMGVPVLTRTGASFASRVAASLLGAVGLGELVVGGVAEYEALAVALARDPAHLARLRAVLESGRASAPLFDSPGLTRLLESAYARVHARWLAGEAPADVDVGG